MRVKDVMTTECFTALADSPIADVARQLLQQRVSALPIIDQTGKLVGTVSEDDLLTAAPIAAGGEPNAFLAASSQGATAADVMHPVDLTFTEDTPLVEAVDRFHRSRLQRIPVTRRGVLIGTVSRTDVLRGVVEYEDALETQRADRQIRNLILTRLQSVGGVRADFENFTVTDGVVQFWGSPPTDQELEIVRAALDLHTP